MLSNRYEVNLLMTKYLAGQTKTGKHKWIKYSEERWVMTSEQYNTLIRSISVFKEAGGREYTKSTFSAAGEQITRLVSIEPHRKYKVEYLMEIVHKKGENA